MRLSAIAYLSTTAALAFTAPAMAYATEAAPPSSTSAEPEGADTGLGEIVVTAQRRAENIQSVPIAITAITATKAQALGVDDLQEMTALVPGFTFQRQASGATPFIRGVGSTSSFIGNEPSVAVFLDDVYVPSGNAAIFEFDNVSSVEVLKGPQGTLFGRNATGGVIHVHTKLPSYTPKMDFSVSAGNYDYVKTTASVSTGITDQIAIGVSGYYTNQDKGWGKNVVTGQDVNTNNAWGVEGKLLFEPDSSTQIVLGALYAKRVSDQGFAQQVAPGYYGLFGYSPTALGAGFYDSSVSRPQYYDTRFELYSAKLTRDLGFAKLVSISAFSRVNTDFEIDLDAAPADVLNGTVKNTGRTFTQEVQLLSPDSSKLKWIVGLFYLNDDSFFGLDAYGLAVTSRFGAGYHQYEQSRQKTNSISGFAQASYEILPRLTFTGGLRFTSDHRAESEAGSSIAMPDGTVFTIGGHALSSGPFASSKTFNALTGRASLDYKVTDDVLLYAAYNRGFKSGVYNLPGYSVTTTSPLPPVNPERLDAYTVGFKSELFDRRVRFNAEAFYYKFNNIQVQNNVPPPNAGTILTNAGKATIKGFEAELTVEPVRRLTITGSISVLDGKYDTFASGPTYFPTGANAPIATPAPSSCTFASTQTFDASGYPIGAGGAPAVQGFCDLSGSKTVNTPPFSSNVAVLYNVPTPIGSIDFAGTWAHNGNYYSEPHNLSYVRQPIYNLINASIGWTSPNDRISLKFWANNLLEEQYYTYSALGATSGPKYSPAAPRTYGMTLSGHF